MLHTSAVAQYALDASISGAEYDIDPHCVSSSPSPSIVLLSPKSISRSDPAWCARVRVRG